VWLRNEMNAHMIMNQPPNRSIPH